LVYRERCDPGKASSIDEGSPSENKELKGFSSWDMSDFDRPFAPNGQDPLCRIESFQRGARYDWIRFLARPGVALDS
jgi:hypothetical protein